MEANTVLTPLARNLTEPISRFDDVQVAVDGMKPVLHTGVLPSSGLG
jgi:hypothetical protein